MENNVISPDFPDVSRFPEQDILVGALRLIPSTPVPTNSRRFRGASLPRSPDRRPSQQQPPSLRLWLAAGEVCPPSPWTQHQVRNRK